jgi:hypothetical protein
MATAEERDIARRAWDRTASAIAGATDVFKPLRERFVKAITEDQPLEDLENDLIDQLAVREWTWEWFEEWRKLFAEWGTFPASWPALAPEPDPSQPYTDDELAEYRRAAVASLIIPTAAMVFFRDRRMTKAFGFEKWTLATSEDPVEQRVAKDKQPAIMAGEFGSLPPFFPGDRTSMRAVKLPGAPGPADDARPAEGAEAAGGDDDSVAAAAAAAMMAGEIIGQVMAESKPDDGDAGAGESDGDAPGDGPDGGNGQ